MGNITKLSRPLARLFLKLKLSYSVLCIVTFLAACSSTSKPPLSPPEAQSRHQKLLNLHYQQWQGTPYRWGGTGRDGLDCSAFVQLTYRQVFNLDLPRTTWDQAKIGFSVPPKQLLAGDIVFFKTGEQQRHNGVYLGDGLFMHASASRGVIVSRLNNPYWSRRYWKAMRIILP